MVKQYAQSISQLLKKILSIPGGLDESSLLFVGHWILSLTENGIITGEMH
jgi:hypothetical protein